MFGNSNLVKTVHKDDVDKDIITVKAWPNPSNDNFNLKVKTENKIDKVQIQVYDALNKLLYYNEFDPNQEYSFGKELVAGVYIVKLMQAEKILSVRVVKY